jgi:hypothetical protein
MDATFIVDITWKIWTVGLTFYVAHNRGQHRMEAKLETLFHDVNGFGQRVSMMETKVADMPGHRELAEIHEKINSVGHSLARLEGEIRASLDAQRTTLNTIYARLTTGGGHG